MGNTKGEFIGKVSAAKRSQNVLVLLESFLKGPPKYMQTIDIMVKHNSKKYLSVDIIWYESNRIMYMHRIIDIYEQVPMLIFYWHFLYRNWREISSLACYFVESFMNYFHVPIHLINTQTRSLSSAGKSPLISRWSASIKHTPALLFMVQFH